jgi:hypothetical protein
LSVVVEENSDGHLQLARNLKELSVAAYHWSNANPTRSRRARRGQPACSWQQQVAATILALDQGRTAVAASALSLDGQLARIMQMPSGRPVVVVVVVVR